MEKKDIQHLASLARIRITDEEADALGSDITQVLEYVGAINEIVSDFSSTKKVGSVHNVFRKDEVTNQPGEHTDALLSEAPTTKNGYVQVKKILQNE